MKKNQLFTPAVLTFAVAAALQPNLVQAQNEMMEEVVVTGTRGALMRAQDIKMDETSITDVLSAEDIGKLPDTSIAESLARLPGLAGERVNGRTSGVAIRGFKEDFTGTSLNGRELIGIGDNRGVEYDLYPSEIMTGGVVYKSTDATQMVQGIGGSVDLRTVRPLDAPDSVFLNYIHEMNERSSDNPDIDDTGSRYAIAFNKTMMDDKLGLALAYADTETPNNQRKYGVWGYGDNGSGQFLPFGNDTNVQGTVLERETLSAVVQFRPSESVDVVVDYLDIDYSDSGMLRGFIEPFSFDNVEGSGYDVSGDQINANPVLRTDPINKEGELQAIGLNVKWNATDNLSVMLDYADSEADKFDQRAESYAGLARSGTLDSSELTGTRSFQMSEDGIFFTGQSGLEAFADPSMLQLTGPQVWGGGMASIADQFETDELQANGDPFSYLNAQDGFNNFATFHEELTTTRLELEYSFDDGVVTSVIVGGNYSDRYKDKVNTGQFVTTTAYPLSDSIPSNYVVGLADLTWAGLGRVVAYDGNAPYNDGTYVRNDAGALEPDRLGDTYIVEEEVTTLYAQLNFETELAGMRMFGNVGLQYVDTDQSSSGYIGVAGPNKRVCDEAGDGGAPDASCETSISTSYSHTLPSLNVSLEVAENQFVRFAYSTTISRARLDQMKASGFVKFDQNIDLITIPNTEAAVQTYGTPWSKVAGNPLLKPLESNNFDLSYENYFSEQGYVSIAGFYKDIKNWTRRSNQLINFRSDATNGGADYFVPGFHDRVIDQDGLYGPLDTPYSQGDVALPPDYGYFDAFEDGLTGEVTGFEAAVSLGFGDFVPELQGLGVMGSATWLDPKLDDGSSIPGMSDEITSFVVFYERGGFEARVAMTDRDGFSTYERGGSNKIAEATRDDVTLVDAQLSYDFAAGFDGWLSNLRVSLQGQNLTDEEESTIDGNGIVQTRRSFGPTYLLNFNYSFDM